MKWLSCLPSAGGEIALPEIERTAARADVVEPLAVRFPQRPTAVGILVEQAAERLAVEIVHPDLAGLRTVIALAPPGRPLAREQQSFAVRRQTAVLSVVVEQQTLGLALGGADGEEAFGMAPEVIACGVDEQTPAIGTPLLQRAAGGMVT